MYLAPRACPVARDVTWAMTPAGLVLLMQITETYAGIVCYIPSQTWVRADAKFQPGPYRLLTSTVELLYAQQVRRSPLPLPIRTSSTSTIHGWWVAAGS